MKSRKEIDNELRMLQGNINRMFITHDSIELSSMFRVAQNRIGIIYEYNRNRLDLEFDKYEMSDNKWILKGEKEI